jgi:hypothetical protein
MTQLSASLNSADAVNGRVYILAEWYRADGRLDSREVLTYNDTTGDYGDCFNPEERALLANNEQISRNWMGHRVSIQGRVFYRSMTAATIGL